MTVYDFTQGIPKPWRTYDGDRTLRSNVVVEDGAMSLWTRPFGAEWRGATMTFPNAFTYGRVSVECRADAAKWTKALLMLIYPAEYWPPEIDFLEMGGDVNWDRHKIALTAHYGEVDPVTGKHPETHRAIALNMTDYANVWVDWDPYKIEFGAERGGVPMIQTIPNPGISVPLKPHITYWPTRKRPTDPWPEAASRMQVRSVEMT